MDSPSSRSSAIANSSMEMVNATAIMQTTRAEMAKLLRSAEFICIDDHALSIFNWQGWRVEGGLSTVFCIVC